MKGIIFTEFLEMVEERFGIEILDELTTHKGKGCPMSFTSVGNYPHQDLVGMVTVLSKRTGIDLNDLLTTFGRHLYSMFQKKFPHFLEHHTDPLDILEGIETVIHTEVRKLYPEARLPHFECERPDKDTLIMSYSSNRPFAGVADGLIHGCIESFGETVAVDRQDHEVESGSASTFTLKRIAS
ncbi:heme NO-binding domain-containing protein [Pelagicoccus enzymogenes]|uniref:heme NO-binding domain-containing protein n=1 Tax=Pelagicoccus enzymogenes TaxID=2773457 RepID=UPI00280DFFB0|nr:heme NO-binding domain-containing protein [Pelagicoccus enzymogenes]MDQ8200945.1 heme NO-binding domain-containing protein [Pelagicoccus enzymogenes]